MEENTPEQLTKNATSAYQNGDYAQAAIAFGAAAEIYHSSNQPLMSVEMRNNQSVALLQANDAQAAYQAVAGLDSVFKEVGDNLKLGITYGNQAAALEALDKLEEAEEKYKLSADLLKKAGASDLYTEVMKSISAIQLRTGRQLEAIASMQSGVEDIKKPSLKNRLLKKLLKIPSSLLKK
jgi:tetratricopeptide (TPR) repeat protein